MAGDVASGGVFTSAGSIIGPTGTIAGDVRPTKVSCRVPDSQSLGFNFVTESSCGLEGEGDLMDGAGPLLAALEDHPDGLVLLPMTDSPVLSRIPTGRCAPVLPAHVPAGQLVELDWDDIMARDQLGTVRDGGVPCDIGAAQIGVKP